MTDWHMPRGVKRTPLPPEAVLVTPPKKPRRAPQQARGGSFVGGVVVSLPFDRLCPDNQKYFARAIKGPNGRIRAAVFLSPKYRAAKQFVQDRARAAMEGNTMATVPVAVTFKVWMPDKRQRDMMNYGKLLCDALSGIVYEDDSLIHQAHWNLMGIDRASPRIDVIVSRYVSS